MATLRSLIQEQDLVVGLMIQRVCSPWIAKIYRDAGADFIFVENEHMFFNESDLADLILASRAYGLPVVAKTEYVSRASICKLLDAGATGIQVPMSETAEQLEEAVSYAKFPPLGVRAVAPGIGNSDYAAVDSASWIEQMNEETVVLAHIETMKGVDNVDEILQVPGVDIMYVGLLDLCISCGCPGNYNNPKVVDTLSRLLDSARRHGKTAGMWVPSFEFAEPWIAKGMRFLESVGDVGFVTSGARDLMDRFPGHGPRQ